MTFPRPHRVPAVLAVALAVAILVAGCGGSTDVDRTKAAETVRASLESTREGFGTKVESVDCPGGVKAEAGAHFECTVRYPDGTVAYAQLKVRDKQADLTMESLTQKPRGG